MKSWSPVTMKTELRWFLNGGTAAHCVHTEKLHSAARGASQCCMMLYNVVPRPVCIVPHHRNAIAASC